MPEPRFFFTNHSISRRDDSVRSVEELELIACERQSSVELFNADVARLDANVDSDDDDEETTSTCDGSVAAAGWSRVGSPDRHSSASTLAAAAATLRKAFAAHSKGQRAAEKRRRPAQEKKRGKKRPLDGILGHSLPFNWMLAHELMLDPNFTFDADCLALPDGPSKKIVRVFLAAMRKEKQADLAVALERLMEGGDEARETHEEAIQACESVVIKQLDEVSRAVCSVSSSRAPGLTLVVKEGLDGALMCQMLHNGSFGRQQLISLVDAVAAALTAGSVTDTMDQRVAEWKQSVVGILTCTEELSSVLGWSHASSQRPLSSHVASLLRR